MNVSELQLQELRRFAALGRLSATMLHEISNPLSAAMIQLELSDHSSPAVRRAKRNMQTLRRYVEAARQQITDHGHSKNFSVQPQMDQLRRVLLPIARHAGVHLEIGPLPIGCKLHGDPVKFQQVVANLVVNAIQSYDRSQAYKPATLVRLDLVASDKWLIVQVTDWGKGIAVDELSKIFEPFYTTKGETGLGLGLGLAIVKQHVTSDFKGSIKVSSSLRRGTRFTVKLRRSI